MFASSWLRQLRRRWLGRPALRRLSVRRVRPCLAVLEKRLAPAVTLSISNPLPLPEGDSGSSDMLFVVTRSGDLGPSVQVHYATQDGTGANGAKAGSDYVATSGTLILAPDQTTATIEVPVIGNTLLQPDRSFTVLLSNPEPAASFASQQTFDTGSKPVSVSLGDVNGDGRPDLLVANGYNNTVSVLLNTTTEELTLGTATATGTIHDDDAPASITPSSGDNQSATINSPFANPLVVAVRNAAGDLVQGVSVTFTAPASGPSGSFAANATVLTDANGLVTAPPFVANGTAGSYQVTATAAGGSNPSTAFNLSNAPANTTTTAGAAAIQFPSVTIVPNLLALNQTETIAVHVSGPGGVVNQGTVTFSVNGHSMSVSVDGNGDATVHLTLPLLTAAFPQSIQATFSGPNRLPATATPTAFWGLMNALLPGAATFAADGGQSVQSFLLGLPLLDFLYSSSGQLMEVVFGPDVLSWDFRYVGSMAVISVDGVLPMAIAVSTPQGLLLEAL